MSASMRELGTFIFPFLLLCSCSFSLPRSSFSILPFVLLAVLLPFLIPPSRFPLLLPALRLMLPPPIWLRFVPAVRSSGRR